MLNISGLSDGIVLDHIPVGKSMDIYKYLELSKLDCQVAIIKNARSNKMGRKDIIKIENTIDIIDLDVLGFVDPGITVNIIKDGAIVEKKKLQLPKKLKNVVRCKNPRCITSVEEQLPQIFFLSDPKEKIYRCQYCEEKYNDKRKKKNK
jgi:aspartate carbamoyltransferase regulatory subunit